MKMNTSKIDVLFLWIDKIPAKFVRPCEFHWKDWRGKYYCVQSTIDHIPGKRSSICAGTRQRDYISDLAYYRVDVEPAELS